MSKEMILREEKPKKVINRLHLFGALVVAVLLIATLLLYNVPVFHAVTTEDKIPEPDPSAIWTVHVNQNGNYSFTNGDRTINCLHTAETKDTGFSLTTAPAEEGKDTYQDWNLTQYQEYEMTFFVSNRALTEAKGKVFLGMEDGKLALTYAEKQADDSYNLGDGYALQFFLKGKGEEHEAPAAEEETEAENEEAEDLENEAETEEPAENPEDVIQEDEVADVIDLDSFVLRTDLREGEEAILYCPSQKLAVTASDDFTGVPVTITTEIEKDSYSLRGVIRQQEVDILYTGLIIATAILLLLSFLPVFFRKFEHMKVHVLTITLAIVHLLLMALMFLIFKTNICAYVRTNASLLVMGWALPLLPVAAIVVQLFVKRKCYIEP